MAPGLQEKTTLIRQTLAEARVYDLLDSETYRRLLKRPQILEEEKDLKSKIIVIDEIQKQPGLLDEVHRLLQKTNCCFLLTGSQRQKTEKKSCKLIGGKGLVSIPFPSVLGGNTPI